MQSPVLYYTGTLDRDSMTDVGGIRLPIKKYILTIFFFAHYILFPFKGNAYRKTC